MFGLSNFIITEFLLIFYSLVTNVLYSYKIIYSLPYIYHIVKEVLSKIDLLATATMAL